MYRRDPGVETPGYFRSSLRDDDYGPLAKRFVNFRKASGSRAARAGGAGRDSGGAFARAAVAAAATPAAGLSGHFPLAGAARPGSAGAGRAGLAGRSAGDGLIQRDDFADSEAVEDFGVEVIRSANGDRAALERVVGLHENKAVAAFGKDRGQRHRQDVVRGGNRDAEDGGHAGAHAGVDVLDRDTGGKSLDPVFNHSLRGDALDDPRHLDAGHRLRADFHRAAFLKADDVGLVDVGVDNHLA